MGITYSLRCVRAKKMQSSNRYTRWTSQVAAEDNLTDVIEALPPTEVY